MGRDFTVKAMTAERVAQAYPLIQTSNPSLTFELWKAFAERHLAANGNGTQAHGILLVDSEGGFIVGLVAYHSAFDLHHGPVLVAEHLLAFDLLDRTLIAKQLIAELERIAEDHGCKAIHTNLPDVRPGTGGHWLNAFLQARGHHIEGLSLCKALG